jgi:hypothetical protein
MNSTIKSELKEVATAAFIVGTMVFLIIVALHTGKICGYIEGQKDAINGKFSYQYVTNITIAGTKSGITTSTNVEFTKITNKQ